MKKLSIILLFILLLTVKIHAQYESPLKIPLYLSGNFGELRNNHFHSGIDFKTQGVINKPIYSIEDGYISRISVSPGGFGLALYVTHPSTGQVSVYGHLESFIPEIADYVKEKQYEQESYRVNLFPGEGTFNVKKGGLIAYSGNTGSSGGPHLHFEIRDAVTENVIDPLYYYKNKMEDKVSPELRGIAVYPVQGEGVVNGSRDPLRQNIQKTKQGQYQSLKTAINVWGKIGVGVKAYDKMTGTQNIYGVRIIRLFVDNNKLFESEIHTFSFDQTRMLNSFIDFEDWRLNKSFFMKSFVEPGNKLPFYKVENGGYLTINEERTYNIRYELEDIYGNKTDYKFQITGKKQPIPELKKGSLYMAWNEDNYYISDNFTFTIPKGNLYDDFIFVLKKVQSDRYDSDLFVVNDVPVPLHNEGRMRIALKTDTLQNKSQYGIISIDRDKQNWIGGSYEDGKISVPIREIGYTYAVASDNNAPDITPVQPEKWEKESTIKIKVTDDLSGVLSCKGMIDGKYTLFGNDMKSPVYTYKFDPERLEKGKKHELTFTAADACGNTSEYKTEFYY